MKFQLLRQLNHDAVFFDDNLADRAPLEAVWQAVYQSKHWPTWWHYVVRVQELERGENGGVGNVRLYTWRTRLLYQLSFDVRTTRIARLALLEGEVCGQFEGCGRWRLYLQDGITAVRYNWEVNVQQSWLRFFLPPLRRAMQCTRWNFCSP